MSEKEFTEQVADVLADETPIQITINIREAWVLISLLQLASRHPGMSRRMRNRAKELANQFGEPIINRHPKIRKLMGLGWDSRYDR